MSLSDQLAQAFNAQINLELESAYAYLGMAGWCEANDLTGFAQWFRSQAREEVEHGMKFFSFVLNRDQQVRLMDIAATPADFGSVLDVFRAALAHEQRVTAAITDLYAKVTAAQDFASVPILNWFTDEQIEEEATVRQIVAELERIGDNTAALVLLDREMAQRRSDAGSTGAL
jgi:ferritin